MQKIIVRRWTFGLLFFFVSALIGHAAEPTEKELVPLIQNLVPGIEGDPKPFGPSLPFNAVDRNIEVKILKIETPEIADVAQMNLSGVRPGNKVWPVRTHIHVTYAMSATSQLPGAGEGNYTCYAFFQDGNWMVTKYQPAFKKSVFKEIRDAVSGDKK
jgi:hypothetical protein